MIYALYIASFAGAVALLMMMPRKGYNPRRFGALLGALTLGCIWLWLSESMADGGGLAQGALPYYYIFSALAIGAAVRVITHTRPVYSALWFVMVVLASSGLLLVLNAEFIAFALVIIYGGAILVTYVFVIMLASQAGEGETELLHNAVAREPVAGVAAGFLLLAMLLTVAFPADDEPFAPNEAAAALSDAALIDSTLPNRAAAALASRLNPSGETTGVHADLQSRAQSVANIERVGVDLFEHHPLGLELAGVILLVSLVGAVVIARQRMDVATAAPPSGDEA